MSYRRYSLATFLGLGPLLLAALLTSCTGGSGADGEGEVLVVLLIDTLRRDSLGAYGSPDADTPRMDEQARSRA